MRRFALCAFLVLASHPASGEGTRYQDQPVEGDERLEVTLKEYRVRARASLPHFRKEFERQQGRSFYVVTRLFDGQDFEQIFVRVEAITGAGYEGTIASEPLGKVRFNPGDPIAVASDAVQDWMIVNPDGTEEGNLQGKALDLLQVGAAAVVVKLRPENGEYATFEAVSALNPKTQQEVTELVPEEVLAAVEARVAAAHKGSPAAADEDRFTYLLVRFPGWELVEPEAR